jgi:hypothetical protein
MNKLNVPITGLTLPQFCVCPKPGFLTSYNKLSTFIMFNGLRREVVFCFVDIGGIVDHHCLNFLFMMMNENICVDIIHHIFLKLED